MTSLFPLVHAEVLFERAQLGNILKVLDLLLNG